MKDSLIIEKLENVANVLRRDVLKMTTEAGSGHPNSCLSCAEIMSTLFFHEMKYDVNNPFHKHNDEFILSKGHAAPILYSCLYHAGCISDNLLSLRTFASRLEGHPVPSIEWVKVATGSLGQGLSAGVGMALAGKLSKKQLRVYVLLGDSEMSEGSVYEAFQLAAYYRLSNLVAIIDVNRLGQRGETMFGYNIAAYKKRVEGFGWDVMTIDGHSLKEILRAFEKARVSTRPVVILAKTIKGKGISFIENKNGWHGKALDTKELVKALASLPNIPFPQISITAPKIIPEKKVKPPVPKLTPYKQSELVATREAYGNALAYLAHADKNVLALDGEVSNSTFSDKVKKKTPKQFIECFIAEQHMISMALGLSKKGFKVFASTFAAFLSRAHDQIRMAGYSGGNFTICGTHAGVSIGADGSSQMGLEDIALFRSTANSSIFCPCDAISCEKIVQMCKELRGICYIRTMRPKTPIIYRDDELFELGDFKILRQSPKDTIILVGLGITVHECLRAHEQLKKKGIASAVIDLFCVKPFNEKKFKEFVKYHGNKIIISEDHYPQGGIGEMLSMKVVNNDTKLVSLAVRKMPRSGTTEELLRYEEINAESIVNVVNGIVKKD